MMFPTTISQFFKMQSPIAPGGAIAPWKYALGGAIAGGAATVAYLGGKGQQLSTEQKAGISASPTSYNFPAAKDVTLNYPSGAAIAQTATPTQTSQPVDYMQWILIGGIAIAALWVFTRRKK